MPKPPERNHAAANREVDSGANQQDYKGKSPGDIDRSGPKVTKPRQLRRSPASAEISAFKLILCSESGAQYRIVESPRKEIQNRASRPKFEHRCANAHSQCCLQETLLANHRALSRPRI